MILSDKTIEILVDWGQLISSIQSDTIRENGADLRFQDIEIVNESFALAHTTEFVNLPDTVVGFCNLRSTWARRGFSIPPTVIDAGFSGQLVIELIRHDTREPWPQTGERVLHVVFARTDQPVSQPYGVRGKYQGQTGVTHARPDA